MYMLHVACGMWHVECACGVSMWRGHVARDRARHTHIFVRARARVCVHGRLLLRACQLLSMLRMLRTRARRLLGRLLLQRRRLPRALRRGARRALRDHGPRTGAGIHRALRRGNLRGRKVGV